MKILRKIQEVKSLRKKQPYPAGLVPTMGALHTAHASLIKRAKEENRALIVSIFVNPAQFGPGEDYDSYPRTFEEDLRLCRNAGADAVFSPDAEEMYDREHSSYVKVSGITDLMCGAFRPGHFDGVTTVVAKLFNIIEPDRAYFGQKDYQQFKVIERMNRDLNFNTDIVMCDTVRESDGLAVSSRNSYLDKRQRKQAPFIFRALNKGKEIIQKGAVDGKRVKEEMERMIRENIPCSEIDYIGVYDTETLRARKKVSGKVLLAAAVKIGKARLIDNIIVDE